MYICVFVYVRVCSVYTVLVCVCACFRVCACVRVCACMLVYTCVCVYEVSEAQVVGPRAIIIVVKRSRRMRCV